MTPYWLLYLLPVAMTLSRVRMTPVTSTLLAVVFSAAIGLRYQVGGDWGAYVRYLLSSENMTFFEVLAREDPGYYLLNWISVGLGFDVWFVNLVCGVIFTVGLLRFCRRLPEPLLAFSVAVPYMVIVVAMGYTRQAVALGIAMIALAALIDGRRRQFLIAVVLAATFHKSAVLLVPIAVLAETRNRAFTALWVGVSGLVLYVLFLAEHADRLWHHYVETDLAMASEGGFIRVVMNAFPAALFLLLHRRMALNGPERKMWFWLSVFAIACLPLVLQAPTAVDRVALYFIPLQLVVWSWLPSVFVGEQQAIARLGVIAGYGLVLFVWLNFAVHAHFWLPYRFWLLE